MKFHDLSIKFLKLFNLHNLMFIIFGNRTIWILYLLNGILDDAS